MMSTLSLPTWIRRARRAPAPLPRSFELLAGERRTLALAPGDSLRVDAGGLELHLPARWLGETLVRPSQRLRAGDVHRCVERGEVTIVANETSRVQRV